LDELAVAGVASDGNDIVIVLVEGDEKVGKEGICKLVPVASHGSSCAGPSDEEDDINRDPIDAVVINVVVINIIVAATAVVAATTVASAATINFQVRR
jgi:hypothetical protein